jgi:DNA helicase-2/ATP-dependent DNA helicase PcrA
MYRILRRVMATNRCFFCGVGDVDQVIHAQAGADATFMRDQFDADAEFPVARHPLGTSFRFGPTLARVASRFKQKRVAAGAVHATTVQLRTYREAGEGAPAVGEGGDGGADGRPADAAQAAGGLEAAAPDCAAQVVALALELRGASPKKRGDFAVLLRHPHQSVPLENALLEAGVAYRVHGFESYLLRPEVLLVRGLLAIALRDFGALQGRPATIARIVEAFVFFCDVRFEPPEGEDDATQRMLLDRAIRDIADNTENLFHFLENRVLRQADPAVARRLRAAVAIAQQDRGAGLLDRFVDALDIGWIAARVLVRRDRRLQAVRNIDGLRRVGRAFGSISDLFARLNGAETQQDASGAKASGAITVAHIAAVKGLEFDRVVLPYLRAGEFPASVGTGAAAGDAEDNLFYVAVTRARLQLVLLAHADRPSPFIARIHRPPAAAAA